MKTFKKFISILMVAAVIASVAVAGTVSFGASGTGVGLAEWALNAYNSGWSYVYGGSTPGAVDCSGLIYSYAGGYRVGDAQTFNADYRDYLSDSIPNIHGLGLYKPGHVGVYVGNGMAVDARGDEYGVCYESVWSHGWTQYFKVPGVSYPDTGWVEFAGEQYYYENGEYLANTSKEIDGETYYFDASGACTSTPTESKSEAATDDNDKIESNNTDTEEATEAQTEEKSKALKNGSTGTEVEKLQARLQELGYYSGVIDGDFGEQTEKAFKLFQKAMGLYVDGIAGSDADYLYADDAPSYTAEDKDTEDAPTEEKDEPAETGVNEDEEAAEDVDLPEESEDAEIAEETEEESDELLYQLGDVDDAIAPIQERLIVLEYLDSEADGAYGAQTEEAVIGFQTANKIVQTGIVDQETYDVLFSDDAIKNPVEKATEADKAPTEEATEADKAAAVAEDDDKTVPTDMATDIHVEKTTREMAAKSVAAVTDSINFQKSAKTTNFEFLLWLVVMIVVMMITFAIAYAIEKKKARAAARAVGRRYQ